MRSKINVDESAVIKMIGDAYMRRLSELASKFDQHTGSTTDVARETIIDLSIDTGKVDGTLLSPGLKMKMKDATASWPAGSLWVVSGPVEPASVKLTHDNDENREEIIVLRSEMDAKFELR